MKTYSQADSRNTQIKPDACRILFQLFMYSASSVCNLHIFPTIPLLGLKIDRFQAVYASRGVDVHLHGGEKRT